MLLYSFILPQINVVTKQWRLTDEETWVRCASDGNAGCANTCADGVWLPKWNRWRGWSCSRTCGDTNNASRKHLWYDQCLHRRHSTKQRQQYNNDVYDIQHTQRTRHDYWFRNLQPCFKRAGRTINSVPSLGLDFKWHTSFVWFTAICR